MKANKKKIWIEVKRYIIITLALLVMVFGWTAFLIPNHVLGGGVSGIATLIFYATGLSTGISVFVINGILVLISLKEHISRQCSLGWRKRLRWCMGWNNTGGLGCLQ